MRIGSWPGSLSNNPFFLELSAGLKDCGVEFIEIDEPSKPPLFSGDAILIQFPDQVFWRSRTLKEILRRINRELIALKAVKLRGVKIIWVIHNLIPHDLKGIRRYIWRWFSSRLVEISDGYMSLCPNTKNVIVSTYPKLANKPYDYFRHPAYSNVVRPRSDALRRRQELGVGKGQYLIGSLGMIKPYKGLEYLISAFQGLEGSQYRLLIAGSPAKAQQWFADLLVERASPDPRIQIILKRMSDEDFAQTVATCDILVAPHLKYLHSGALVYAVSASKRVLTPYTSFSSDLAKAVGKSWVMTYSGQITTSILADATAESPPEDGPDLTPLARNEAGERIRAFVETLCHHRL